jgi:acetoin utilization deacetylase AcuC-like enzyme
VNLPLQAGTTDADMELVYERAVAPILRQFRPELILVSAGFDAHADDPLGGLRLTTAQFARLTALLADIADDYCEGRLVAVTEGGYDLKALASCLRAVVRVLDGDESTSSDVPGGAAPRGEATLAAVRPHLSRYWRL